MTHDLLETVLRLRQRAVDNSRRGLAASLAAATVADDAARVAEQDIRHETEIASDPAGDDRLVEAFAAWLPAARQRALQARGWHERQEAEVARCRADLAASRTALETIEQLVADRRAQEQEAAARREQQALDEAASRIRKVGG